MKSSECCVFFVLTILCLCCTVLGCASSGKKAKYIGCYQDSKSNRDLSQTVSGNGDMSNEVCEKRCRTAGTKYFGLQSGEECWCGDSYGKYGVMEEASCNRNCNGNAEEICGGVVVNSVYEIVY